MSHRPENSDPIASAGHIDDPDQPAEINGDRKRAGRGGDTAAGRGAAHHDADGATSAAAARSDERAARGSGKPPKAVKESGFPNVDASEVEAQHGHDVDSASAAAGRKFQPPAGRKDPNVPNLPPAGENLNTPQGRGLSDAARNDRDGDSSEAETYGTPENTGGPEPITHSRAVEDRVQQQEHDYNLEETEDGERYMTPREGH